MDSLRISIDNHAVCKYRQFCFVLSILDAFYFYVSPYASLHKNLQYNAECSGEGRHPWLVPTLGSLSPLGLMLTVSASQMPFIRSRKFPSIPSMLNMALKP